MPVWNSGEYARRLVAQEHSRSVHVIAWDGEVPIGRGMVLFPEHEEYSVSATCEDCAEVRDVFVVPERRRSGVATAVICALEDVSRANGWSRIGLAVATSEDAEPARRLYEALGFRPAHGPFISSATLASNEGPLSVGSAMTYLVKER
ncbi:MAG: GNAT family N-acetyltransferase [Actinomycetota bacterium]